MAHKEPVQLERLLNRLSYPMFDLYVHLDKKINIRDFEYLESLHNVIFIKNRVRCNWGGFSFVRAITESVREILSKETKYRYVNLLSGQDYPLKNNDYIYTFFKENNGRNFISFDESNESEWWQLAKNRYEKYHFTDIQIRGRYRVQKVINHFLPKRNFPLRVKMYGSSNATWWMLTTECLNHIINLVDKNKKITSFMRLTWGADEFFYPTLIMNSEIQSSAINNNYRYIRWTFESTHPDILSINDLEMISKTSCLFARKFDYRVDVAILDAIDDILNVKITP